MAVRKKECVEVEELVELEEICSMVTATKPAALIETHFGTLKDPRAAHSIEHKLIDILIITICATICGANDWEAIAQYGRTKQDWLKTWLELANGIPSPDTFNRVFA